MVVLNFEDPDTPAFDTWRDVWNDIKLRLSKHERTYIFLDEVQRIPQFERLVDGLHARADIDVYITGSNAHMLSGEFAPLLSIRDHHPKTLITLDMDLPADNNGVRQINTYDFLLANE